MQVSLSWDAGFCFAAHPMGRWALLVAEVPTPTLSQAATEQQAAASGARKVRLC